MYLDCAKCISTKEIKIIKFSQKSVIPFWWTIWITWCHMQWTFSRWKSMSEKCKVHFLLCMSRSSFAAHFSPLHPCISRWLRLEGTFCQPYWLTSHFSHDSNISRPRQMTQMSYQSHDLVDNGGCHIEIVCTCS